MKMQMGRLPGEYTRVEYIQSNQNGEYINTGYIGNMGVCVEAKFNLLRAQGSPAVIGSRIGSDRFSFPVYYEGFDFAIRIDSYVGTWDLNRIYTARIVTDPRQNADSRMDIYGDNDYHVYKTTFEKINNNLPLYIFRYNRDGIADPTNRSSLRLYYLKIYDMEITSESIVRDYIPCVRKSDSKPGMYDTVTKTFFTNAGTGEFIVPA